MPRQKQVYSKNLQIIIYCLFLYSGSLFSYGCHGLPVLQPFAGATNRTLQQGDSGSSEAQPSGAGLPVCANAVRSPDGSLNQQVQD